MKKHLHAVRVVSSYEGFIPMRVMWVVEANSKDFTLDDVVRVNEMHPNHYEFGQSFYIGYMTEADFKSSYGEKNSFSWMVSN